MAFGDTQTPNAKLSLINPTRKNWADTANDNFSILDAIIGAYFTIPGFVGPWTNNTAYAVGNVTVDSSVGVLYQCQVANNSSSPPTTFLQERTNHPTYWSAFSTAAHNRGAWLINTAYSANDFVVNGSQYAVANVTHVSGTVFATDVSAGKWTILVDLSAAGSLVLPILNPAVDKNKFVVTNSAGNAYTIYDAATALTLFSTTGTGAIVLNSGASISQPSIADGTANTQAIESADTHLANGVYVDRSVRAVIIRRQVFPANGTYTPNNKLIFAEVECWGAGGGGGSAATGASIFAVGSGGGGGAYSMITLTAAAIGASKAVVVGTGGTAGAASAGSGGNGGDTTFGATLCVAKGGGGGPGLTSTTPFNAGGAGGLASGGTGDVKLDGHKGCPGATGTFANITGAVAGAGGGSPRLGGPVYIAPNSAGAGVGNTGPANSGSGGSAAWCINGVDQAGGVGGTGLCIVTEHCYG